MEKYLSNPEIFVRLGAILNYKYYINFVAFAILTYINFASRGDSNNSSEDGKTQ